MPLTKNRLTLIFTGLACAFVINSCKKAEQNSLQNFLTSGTWQLASVMATNYIGNTQVSIDTLNDSCHLTQTFMFSINKTCTYVNFDCITQTAASASWSFTPNQLYLMADVVCKDTTAAGSSMPFSYAQIQNLGQFSLILVTGDIQPNFSLTAKRRTIQYGFIKQRSTITN